MEQKHYYIFAKNSSKEYGLPEVHVVTPNLMVYGKWGSMLSFLSRIPNLEKMTAVYERPKPFRESDRYRDLLHHEIETWKNGFAHIRKNGNYNNKAGH